MKTLFSWGRIQRVGLPVLMMVIGLSLTACKAYGGAKLSPDAFGVVSKGDAYVGFSFKCENRADGRSWVHIQLAYHDRGPVLAPPLKNVYLVGTAEDVMLKEGVTCEAAGEAIARGNTTLAFILDEGIFNVNGAAVFKGCYKATKGANTYPPTGDVCSPATDSYKGRFVVAVEDNGKASQSLESDRFFIELQAGEYNLYAREGEVVSGDIKVVR